jgi:Ni/Co efflux regulator RcnB
MKNVLLTGALIAATMAPAAAQAQDHRWDNQRDHREVRLDQREDWQRWRDAHRNDYRRGAWRAPFAYRSFNVGMSVPRDYWAPQYYISNWGAYRLPAPAYGYYRYVRHYDDVLLINMRTGRVLRVYHNFYW